MIFSQHTGFPYEWMSQAMRDNLVRRAIDPRKGWMRPGSTEWEILPELRPGDEDLVLPKHAASFFVGTPLEGLLRNRGIQTLLLTGVATEMGVDTTARHAVTLGVPPVVVEDAVGGIKPESHAAALSLLRSLCEVSPTASVISRLPG